MLQRDLHEFLLSSHLLSPPPLRVSSSHLLLSPSPLTSSSSSPIQVAGPTSQGGLELAQVGRVSGGVGAGGSIGGGATYMLGTAELGDVPKAERVAFISGLTATALPIAAPAAAGLLGCSFLNSFPGGVEVCMHACGKRTRGLRHVALCHVAL